MAITSEDIQNQSFSIDRKGYDVDEVDVFLEHMAAEVDAFNAQIADLQAQLEDARSAPAPAPVEKRETSDYDYSEKDAKIRALEKQLDERKKDDNAIAQALITAQRSGDEIIANAKNVALTTQQDAEDEAKRIIDKANAGKQRILETISNLQNDREQTREDYQDILKDFISSATKKLTEIGGDNLSKSFQTTGRVASHSRFAADSLDASTATYTTPAVPVGGTVTPTAPKPSQPEKDLSGFGEADDSFEFGDVE